MSAGGARHDPNALAHPRADAPSQREGRAKRPRASGQRARCFVERGPQMRAGAYLLMVLVACANQNKLPDLSTDTASDRPAQKLGQRTGPGPATATEPSSGEQAASSHQHGPDGSSGEPEDGSLNTPPATPIGAAPTSPSAPEVPVTTEQGEPPGDHATLDSSQPNNPLATGKNEEPRDPTEPGPPPPETKAPSPPTDGLTSGVGSSGVCAELNAKRMRSRGLIAQAVGPAVFRCLPGRQVRSAGASKRRKRAPPGKKRLVLPLGLSKRALAVGDAGASTAGPQPGPPATHTTVSKRTAPNKEAKERPSAAPRLTDTATQSKPVTQLNPALLRELRAQRRLIRPKQILLTRADTKRILRAIEEQPASPSRLTAAALIPGVSAQRHVGLISLVGKLDELTPSAPPGVRLPADEGSTTVSAPMIHAPPCHEPAATGAVLLNHTIHCTGTLIASDVVLTAAHCLCGHPVDELSFAIETGNGASGGIASILVEVDVIEAEAHAGYDPVSLVNDVALLYLDRPVTFAEPLPFAGRPLPAVPDEKLLFSGYGYANLDKTLSGDKRCADLGVSVICNGTFYYVTDELGQQTCNGDSGGPALMTVGGRSTIVGVTSWGDPECTRFGVDTDVGFHAAWLRAQLDAWAQR